MPEPTKERRRPHTADHSHGWTDAEREAYREERAADEEARRAGLAGMDMDSWQSLKRQNELARGEVTQRYFQSLKGEK